MKKVVFISFITLMICCGCSHDKSKNQSLSQSKEVDMTNYHKKNFDSLMLVDKHLELDFCGELLADKAFVDILEHGSFYKENVVEFISKKQPTPVQVLICLCAMQKLNPKDYISFCKFLLSQFDRGVITEDIIDYAIYSPPEFLNKNRIFIDNYDDQMLCRF